MAITAVVGTTGQRRLGLPVPAYQGLSPAITVGETDTKVIVAAAAKPRPTNRAIAITALLDFIGASIRIIYKIRAAISNCQRMQERFYEVSAAIVPTGRLPSGVSWRPR